MRHLALFLLSINLSILCDVTSYGQIGYINTPSAYTMKKSSVAIALNRDNPIRSFNFTASAFDWLDAGIFYTDITTLPYPSFNQSYKDKGLNFKLRLKEEGEFPAIAIGINDIAGTGISSSEYIVFSRKIKNLEYSYGVGWGQFNEGIKFRNPFSYLSNKFLTRSGSESATGGEFNLDNYFSGPDAVLFGGAAYKINNSTKLVMEIDPTRTDSVIPYKNSKMNLNIGLQKKIGKLNGSIFLMRGNSINLQISYPTS